MKTSDGIESLWFLFLLCPFIFYWRAKSNKSLRLLDNCEASKKRFSSKGHVCRLYKSILLLFFQESTSSFGFQKSPWWEEPRTMTLGEICICRTKRKDLGWVLWVVFFDFLCFFLSWSWTDREKKAMYLEKMACQKHFSNWATTTAPG